MGPQRWTIRLSNGAELELELPPEPTPDDVREALAPDIKPTAVFVLETEIIVVL